jgi:hypothetical protein
MWGVGFAHTPHIRFTFSPLGFFQCSLLMQFEDKCPMEEIDANPLLSMQLELRNQK